MNVKFFMMAAGFLYFFSGQSLGQTVGADDFDGNQVFLVRSISPDNSANGGTFPGSVFDVFGIVNRDVNNDFRDDTLINPAFVGLVPQSITDNFFGSEDLENGDNPDGTGTLLYEFNIAGASNLVFSADFAARGDFETADLLEIEASIDGAPNQLLIELLVDEDAILTYTYEDGITTEEIPDPMTINGTFLDNNFQNFSANINGTGNILVLTLSFVGNGGSETIAVDNILVEGMGGKLLVGDVNCDGVVDLQDVQPFVDVLSSGANNPKADIDGNGVVNLSDVGPFVALLSGG